MKEIVVRELPLHESIFNWIDLSHLVNLPKKTTLNAIYDDPGVQIWSAVIGQPFKVYMMREAIKKNCIIL